MFGNYRNKVDEKSRVAIPAKLRKQLSGNVYISQGFDGTLELRDEKSWNEYSAEITRLSSFDKNARMLQRAVLANAYDFELDKQGRILMPKPLLDSAKITDTIVFTALGNRIEIWAEEAYDEYQKQLMSGGLEEAAEAINADRN